MADEPLTVSAEPPPWEPALKELIDAYDRAYQEIAAIITAIEPAQQAFEQATDLSNRLGDTLRERIAEAANLRALMVTRIWKEEELSLSHLAKKIGVSKARADQITRAAKPAATRED